MRKICKGIMLMLFMTLICQWGNGTDASAASKLQVSYIDIGQGNATLIQYKGKNLLIDTGEESRYAKLKTYLNKKKIKTIHNMILTHYDSDHMGSSDLVIEDYAVKKVSVSAYADDNKGTFQVKELNQAIQKYKVKKARLKAGNKIKIASGVNAKVLSPSVNYGESNENSVVIRLDHKKRSFLFTGDIDSKVENAIYAKYNVNVDVLQVAHHGSDYASGIQFLKKVSPTYAIVSVGAGNSYGHPKSSVLNRIKNFTKKTLRTDKNGTIVVTSDGKKLSVKKVKGSYDKTSTTSTSTSKVTPSASSASGSIIGNVNTKVYHSASCGSLPYEKNRVYFKSAADAEAAGYRAHSTCQ